MGKHDWGRLFQEADSDKSGRLTYAELEAVLRNRLGKGMQRTANEVLQGLSCDDLRSLWACVDANHSGEVTAHEWRLCLYRLELETWPDDEDAVTHVVGEMNAAATKWHRAGGNWYKVFRLIDSDNSGHMGFDELREIVHRPLPCLAIPTTRVTDRDLRAMWKALDVDRSGDATVREFMCFMRKRGAQHGLNFHRQLSNSSKLSRIPRAESRVFTLAVHQAELLSNKLSTQSTDSFMKAYQTWGLQWTGCVSEWDLLKVLRELLHINEEEIDDDGVHAAWRFFDRDNTGEVMVDVLLALGRELGGQETPREAQLGKQTKKGK